MGTGTATFDGSKTGNILADFMLGLPVTFWQGTLYGFSSPRYLAALEPIGWRVGMKSPAYFVPKLRN